MIGKESPAEMRRYIRAKLGLTDAELLASFNQRILEAQEQHPNSSTAGDTLRLLRDALLRETKRKPKEQPKRKRTKAKK